MLEGLTFTLPGLTTAGTGVLVTLFVLLVFFGKLIPKSTVDKMEKSYEEALKAQAEDHAQSLKQAYELATIWKDAYQANTKVLDTKEQTLRDAIDGLKTVEFLIRAMRAIGEERHDAVAALENKITPPQQ